jgi:hypothetical protein
MAEPGTTGPIESAKSAVLLVRETTITLAIVGLLGLLLLSPPRLRDILEKAGIQSVKLPLFEIQTSLDETAKQLASAKAEVKAAQDTALKAQTELAAAKAQLDDVLKTAKLGSDSQTKLQDLSARLVASKDQAATSARSLVKVSGTLDQSALRQRMLSQRIMLLRNPQ